jgi:hypothetical protein
MVGRYGHIPNSNCELMNGDESTATRSAGAMYRTANAIFICVYDVCESVMCAYIVSEKQASKTLRMPKP